jgi:hypothetical protein
MMNKRIFVARKKNQREWLWTGVGRNVGRTNGRCCMAPALCCVMVPALFCANVMLPPHRITRLGKNRSSPNGLKTRATSAVSLSYVELALSLHSRTCSSRAVGCTLESSRGNDRRSTLEQTVVDGVCAGLAKQSIVSGHCERKECIVH